MRVEPAWAYGDDVVMILTALLMAHLAISLVFAVDVADDRAGLGGVAQFGDSRYRWEARYSEPSSGQIKIAYYRK
jgi:hypothetical protein